MQLLSSKWDYCRVIFLVNFTKKTLLKLWVLVNICIFWDINDLMVLK